MRSYWFSNKSNINIIYNYSVITITNTMSNIYILANFGKYAISDCPFIHWLLKCINYIQTERVSVILSWNDLIYFILYLNSYCTVAYCSTNSVKSIVWNICFGSSQNLHCILCCIQHLWKPWKPWKITQCGFVKLILISVSNMIWFFSDH